MFQRVSLVLVIALFFQLNRAKAQQDFLPEIQQTIHFLDSIYWSKIYKKQCDIVEKKLLGHLNQTYQLNENMAVSIGVGFSNYVCKVNKGRFQADEFLILKSADRANNNLSEILTKTFGKLIIEKNEGEIINAKKQSNKTTQIICKNAVTSMFEPFMTVCITFIEN